MQIINIQQFMVKTKCNDNHRVTYQFLGHSSIRVWGVWQNYWRFSSAEVFKNFIQVRKSWKRSTHPIAEKWLKSDLLWKDHCGPRKRLGEICSKGKFGIQYITFKNATQDYYTTSLTERILHDVQHCIIRPNKLALIFLLIQFITCFILSPIFMCCSFPYKRVTLNEHEFKSFNNF